MAFITPFRPPIARIVTALLSGLLVAAPARAVFFNPPGNQVPSSISGTSRRGGCAVDEVSEADAAANGQQLVTFLPIVPDPSQVVALTSQEATSLWVYVPPTQAKSVEFSLFDNVAQTFVYLGAFPIEAAGIYRVDLPETVALSADRADAPQDYVWFLDLVCEAGKPAANLSRTGTLKRLEAEAIDPAFAPAIEQADNNLARATVYGEYGLWLDMVAAIAAARSGAEPMGLSLEPNVTLGLKPTEAAMEQAWRDALDLALPIAEREDVDRQQQLQLLLRADMFVAELTDIPLGQ